MRRKSSVNWIREPFSDLVDLKENCDFCQGWFAILHERLARCAAMSSDPAVGEFTSSLAQPSRKGTRLRVTTVLPAE